MTDRKPKAMMVSTGVQVDMEKVEVAGPSFTQTLSTPPLRLQPLTTPPAVMSLTFMSENRFTFPVSHSLEVDFIQNSSSFTFPTIEAPTGHKNIEIELDPFCKADDGQEVGAPELPVEHLPAVVLPKNKKGTGKRNAVHKLDHKAAEEVQVPGANASKSPYEWSVSPKEGISLGKAGSEMPTDTSISPTYRELSELPGLVGNPAFFKFAKCTECRLNRPNLVFWLGDADAKLSNRTFICMKCLISLHGHPKILDHFFQAGQNEPTAKFRELLEMNNHIKHPEGGHERLDEDTTTLNEALEGKVIELTYLATKMSKCFEHVKAKTDRDSRLLAYRLLNETLELIWKAKLILKVPSLSKKLDMMDKAESQYYRNIAAPKMIPVINHQLHAVDAISYGRKCSESDLMQLLITSKSDVPSKKHSFNIDFSEERTCLQKREVRSKTLFDEIDDVIEPSASKPGLLSGKLDVGMGESDQLLASIL